MYPQNHEFGHVKTEIDAQTSGQVYRNEI